ncbi:hypothetical protein [Cupriavidus sp. amp6]
MLAIRKNHATGRPRSSSSRELAPRKRWKFGKRSGQQSPAQASLLEEAS